MMYTQVAFVGRLKMHPRVVVFGGGGLFFMCGAQVNTQENALIWESSGSIIAKNSNLAASEMPILYDPAQLQVQKHQQNLE